MFISRLPRRVVAAPKPAIEPKQAPATMPAETVEFDEDGRRLLAGPIAAPARPVPTVMPPPASRRQAPPPVTTPPRGLLRFPRPAPKPQPQRVVARPAPQPSPPGYPTNCRDAKAPYQPPRPFAFAPPGPTPPPVEVRPAHIAPVTVRVPAPVKRPVVKAQTFTADDVPFTLIGRTSR
jgi:hypothetical protein